MSELEMLQRKFAVIDGIGWEVYNFIDDCDKQLKKRFIMWTTPAHERYRKRIRSRNKQD